VRVSLKAATTTIRIIGQPRLRETPPAPTWDLQHPFAMRNVFGVDDYLRTGKVGAAEVRT
jgi:hypothetical protein